MLYAILDFSLRRRWLVIALSLAMACVGAWSLQALDIDAFPDTTPVQVQVNTVAEALGPDEIERQITIPIEQAIGGLPGLEQLRSISKFGYSQVTVIFEDSVDIYFARQLLHERMSSVELPAGIERPKLGPVSTGLGEIFHYMLSIDGDASSLSEEERIKRLTELRTMHEWVIKPQLRTVPGTAEINTWGGYEKQYQVRIDPERLIKHHLTFDEVVDALERNNRNVGGGSLKSTGQMLLVQGVGRVTSLAEIGGIVVRAEDGVPIRVQDVADVQLGHEIRRGAVTYEGRGEAVLGLGFMLMGENSHQVTRALKERLESIELPPGAKLEIVYDRTELVDHVIETVQRNLFEGGLLVVAILFLFLGNLRAAAIVAVAIPLSMLFAFSGMLRFGIAASLLSLGAIDFGMVVDSSVVMVENCVRHLGEAGRGKSRLEVIRDAAMEVRRPTLFGELIIMIVYLPILTLEGIEGKLFRPMALTVIFALAGSMILSLTLMPVLASFFLPKKPVEHEPFLMRLAHRIHAPLLRFSMDHKGPVIGFAIAVLFVAYVLIAPNLGREFVPRLSEGAILVNVVRPAGTDLEESIRGNTLLEKALKQAFPDEIAHVWSRIGTPEVATDPMGVELTDVFVTLKPRHHWRKARTQDDMTVLIDRELRDVIGEKHIFMQPIEHRLNEMISGVRSDVGIKVFGDDFKELEATAREIERVISQIPGAADVRTEQLTGQPVLEIAVDQEQIARYGVPAQEVLELIGALGGLPVGDVIEGQLRFPLVVRLPEKIRGEPASIGSVLLATPQGERIPLSRLTRIDVVDRPATISREWGQRRITVTANVRLRDLGSFVDEAQAKVAEIVRLPSERYRIEWGGQFEHYESARLRLMIVVPIAGLLIFLLLYFTYHNVVDALRVFTGVPFGWVGGIIALWLRDMPFSISAGVGFIALSGVAVLDDMILVSYVRHLRERGLGLDQAVTQAAITRLRPVLMTTLVASFGFLPMAFSTGMGAEVQRPLATVVIGGVIGAMVMSLLVLRVLYMVFSSTFEHETSQAGAAANVQSEI